MRERRVKIAVFLPALLAVILSVLFFGVHGAEADMGPKPSITLVTYNMPEDCYIALLENDGGAGSFVFWPGKINNEDVKQFLETYSEDGWTVHESPVGDYVFHVTGGTTTFFFTYSVPDPFRVLVVCPDLSYRVSEVLNQVEYNTTCAYDYATGGLKELHHEGDESRESITKVSIWYVLFCLLFTLVIEFALLKGFRLPYTKRNLISFFTINVITNLTYTWFSVWGKPGAGVLHYFLFEVGIALTEAIFYIFALRDDHGDQCPEESFTYGITANVVSAVAGFVLLLIYYAIRKFPLLG